MKCFKGWTFQLLLDELRVRVEAARLWLAALLVRCATRLAGSALNELQALELAALAALAVESSAFWQDRAFAAEAELHERLNPPPLDPEKFSRALAEIATVAHEAEIQQRIASMRENAPNN